MVPHGSPEPKIFKLTLVFVKVHFLTLVFSALLSHVCSSTPRRTCRLVTCKAEPIGQPGRPIELVQENQLGLLYVWTSVMLKLVCVKHLLH